MPQLITRKQIVALPLRARVAFAARCARRDQPWFDGCSQSTPKDRKWVKAAILVAEDYGRGRYLRQATLEIAVALNWILKATIERAQTTADEAGRIAAVRAVNAVIAADAARGAALNARSYYPSRVSDEAIEIAEAAIAAASPDPFSVSPDSEAAKAFGEDLDRLVRRARDEGWTNYSSVLRSRVGSSARFHRPQKEVVDVVFVPGGAMSTGAGDSRPTSPGRSGGSTGSATPRPPSSRTRRG